MKGFQLTLGQLSKSLDGRMQLFIGPVLILLILAMMVLPLPPFVLDMLFTFNMRLSPDGFVSQACFAEKPLDFSRCFSSSFALHHLVCDWSLTWPRRVSY